MNKHSFSLERLAVWVAGLCGLGAVGLISLLAICNFAAAHSVFDEKVSVYQDKLIAPAMYTLIIGAFVVFVCALFERYIKNKKLVLNLATGVVCFCVTIFCVLWVSQSSAIPTVDQHKVCDTAKMLLQGDASGLKHSYFDFAPHQVGLVFLFEGIFRCVGNSNPLVISYLNIPCLLLVIIFGRFIAEELFENETVSLSWIMLCASCLPWLFLITFMYGDYFSWAALMPAIWCTIRVIKGAKLRWGVLAACLSGFAVIARRNSLIFAIAIFLVLLVEAVCKKTNRITILLTVALTLVALVLPNWAINQRYENLTGQAINKGCPTGAYLNMGLSMEDKVLGPGWWNKYVEQIYAKYNSDNEACRPQIQQDLNQTINLLLTNKRQAVRFFWNKMSTLWAEPSYQCLTSTECHDVSKGRSGIPLAVYEDQTIYDNVHKFMNAYQQLVYLAALGGVVWLLFCKNHNQIRLYMLLPLIVFLGGFLFHIVWEAKGRYTLSYLPMLMLYGSLGLGRLSNWVHKKIEEYKG